MAAKYSATVLYCRSSDAWSAISAWRVRTSECEKEGPHMDGIVAQVSPDRITLCTINRYTTIVTLLKHISMLLCKVCSLSRSLLKQ